MGKCVDHRSLSNSVCFFSFLCSLCVVSKSWPIPWSLRFSSRFAYINFQLLIFKSVINFGL